LGVAISIVADACGEDVSANLSNLPLKLGGDSLCKMVRTCSRLRA